jgi:hypothetical protein
MITKDSAFIEHSVALTHLLVSACPAAAQFQVDLSPSEMRLLLNKPAIVDLAVGEVGIATHIRFCTLGTAAMVYSREGLAQSASEFEVSYEVRREPSNAVSLTTMVETGLGQNATSDAIARTFTDPTKCEQTGYPMEDFIQLLSIDGNTSLSQIMPPKP